MLPNYLLPDEFSPLQTEFNKTQRDVRLIIHVKPNQRNEGASKALWLHESPIAEPFS